MIEEISGGRLVIKTYEGGGIAASDTELESCHAGILDAARGGTSVWAAQLPAAPPFTCIVGGPTALEYFFWYMWGPGLDLMQEMLDTGGFNVKPVVSICRGPEVFLYTSFPLTKPEDLSGKKLRLLGDEAAIFSNLNVAATATPSGEIYESYSRGVIDGFQHGTLFFDLTMGFQEIVDYAYMSPVRQATDPNCHWVNKDSWAELPDDLKLLVEQVWWAEGIRYYAEESYECTVATPEWIAAGCKVEPTPKSVEDALIKYSNEFYEERMAKDPFLAKVINSLMEWRDAYAATFPKL
jgi:TRAP-type mannitol/chloroaromatic compound transport system substrate-binding protein